AGDPGVGAGVAEVPAGAAADDALGFCPGVPLVGAGLVGTPRAAEGLGVAPGAGVPFGTLLAALSVDGLAELAEAAAGWFVEPLAFLSPPPPQALRMRAALRSAAPTELHRLNRTTGSRIRRIPP